jgi:threonyl-tRNA synthetase
MHTMTITITLPDKSKKKVKKGSTPLDVAHSISEGLMRATVAAKVDGELVDATTKLQKDCSLQLITFKDPEGKGVFWHSASHLMTQAILRVFPKQKIGLGVGFDIDEGYYQDYDMKTISEEDFKKIEDEMKKIVKERLEVIPKKISKKEALKYYKDDPYKTELIGDIPGNEVTMYCQGEFENLCKGPHVPNTCMLKSFKLTKVAGAYWRGDSKNKQLQRLYGVAYPDKKELKQYVHRIEEALKRDHRKLGKELDLISFQEESPGNVFYHPKGAVIWRELQNFIREEYWKRGFNEVVTPLMYDKSLWETSGHWDHYKDHMFCLEADGKEVSLKPMNCPSHCLIYKNSLKSYRELPLRIADFATLHRNELKGVLGGMTRVRKFNQDDAHIFCTIDQLEEELTACIEFADYVYAKIFGFEFSLELSTRPEKSMGTDAQWKKAETALEKALTKNKQKYEVNPGDGAFYGPKIDLHIKDCLGRSWQLSTIQVDFQLPGRFGLTYEGKDGKKHSPVMIHRAVLGTIDRFMGILIEQYAGRFPLWLSPVQVRVLPLADRFNDYAESVVKELRDLMVRAEFDGRSESLNRKVREAQLDQVNYILVVGEKEKKDNSVSVRTREGKQQGVMSLKKFSEQVLKEIKEKM